MVQQILPWIQLILATMNVCALVFAFYKFLGRPHNTLEQRVTALEIRYKETEESLHRGNDKFRNQETTNEVMQSCMLALIDFELSYCIHTHYEETEDLMKAKDKLRGHLASKQ